MLRDERRTGHPFRGRQAHVVLKVAYKTEHTNLRLYLVDAGRFQGEVVVACAACWAASPLGEEIPTCGGKHDRAVSPQTNVTLIADLSGSLVNLTQLSMPT